MSVSRSWRTLPAGVGRKPLGCTVPRWETKANPRAEPTSMGGRRARRGEIEFGQPVPQCLVQRAQAENGHVVGLLPAQDRPLDGDTAKVVGFGGAGGDEGAGVVDEVEDVFDLVGSSPGSSLPRPVGTSRNALQVSAPICRTMRTISGRSVRLCPVTVVLICTLRPRSRAACQASRVQR